MNSFIKTLKKEVKKRIFLLILYVKTIINYINIVLIYNK